MKAAAETAFPPAVLVGLIGEGIQLSRTPRMHEAEGLRHGLRYIYRLIDIEQLGLGPEALPDLVLSAERCGFTGLNITHPFKQRVIELLDELSDDARGIGAVNTVVFRDGRRIGYNTDCWGFAESFRRNMAGAARGQVLQLGAGGAGVAVARALLQCEVERLSIFDMASDRAEALAATLSAEFGAGRAVATRSPEAALREVDGLVNATPIGMANHPGMPVRPDWLGELHWVADIIYFPLETELMRHARALGCRVMPGIGMALYQAVMAFELFSGRKADPEEMFKHFGPV